MVRIAHISDSHIGCSMFQLIERKEDVRECFRQAVKKAMKYSPDIIIHTGDLFHSPYPDNEDTICVSKTLKELKSTKFFVVPGNHDIPFNYRIAASPIKILESSGLLQSTGDNDYAVIEETIDGKSIEIHLIAWTSPSRFHSHIKKILPKRSHAILFAHAMQCNDIDELPSCFDYMGFGHHHDFSLDKENGIGIPGSTCLVDWKKEKRNKKLIVIDIDNESVEYQTEMLNDVREFKLIRNVDISGLGPEEANNKIKMRIEQLSVKRGKPIIIIEVSGIVNHETESSIDRANLLQYGDRRLDPLFFHIETNWICVGTRSVKLSKPLDVQTSVREYLEQTNHDQQDLLLRELASILEGN